MWNASSIARIAFTPHIFIFGYSQQVSNKTRSCRVRATLQGLKRLLGKNYHRLFAATGDMLGLAAQGRVHHLAELGFGILKSPLA